MSNRLSRLTFAVSLVTASLALAGGWTQVGEGSATFDAKGPAGFKIHGTGKKLTVADDGKTLTVSLALKDVDTDNSLRNRHMMEDIEGEKFPTVSLSVPVDSVKPSADGSEVEADAKGTFTMHGQSKEISFKYKAKCKGGTCEVTASAPVLLTDYGIKIRSYMGITVKPDIVVGVSFTVKK